MNQVNWNDVEMPEPKSSTLDTGDCGQFQGIDLNAKDDAAEVLAEAAHEDQQLDEYIKEQEASK